MTIGLAGEAGASRPGPQFEDHRHRVPRSPVGYFPNPEMTLRDTGHQLWVADLRRAHVA
jgi:hypothetical protein